MRNTFLISGVCSLLAFSAAIPSVAFAQEAPAAAAASLEKDTLKITIDGKSTVAKLQPHNADWSGTEANGSGAFSVVFKKGAVEAGGGSVLSATVSLSLENGGVKESEVVLALNDNKGRYRNQEGAAKPKVTMSTFKVDGKTLEVVGMLETKVFAWHRGEFDESKSFDVVIDFAADLKSLD